jgi:hypothetical protein
MSCMPPAMSVMPCIAIADYQRVFSDLLGLGGMHTGTQRMCMLKRGHA